MQIVNAIKTFLRDEEGAAAIEYALIAALIAIVIAGAAAALGTDISALFGKISKCIATPNDTNCKL